MRKDRLYILGSIVLTLWVCITYLLFAHRPKPDLVNTADALRLQLDLKRDLDTFERRLRHQLKDNGILLKELQVLRNDQIVHPDKAKNADGEQKFVDGANEYEEAPPGVGGGIGDASGGVREKKESLGGANQKANVVIPVLMFACNRVTVTKALDLLLEYRTDPIKFPIIVSQDCGHAKTRETLQGYGDRIRYMEPPTFADVPIPPKEKKFKGYFKIARHYGWALNQTFLEKGHDQVIIVEDDLEVAPDFFEYFEASLPVLKDDDSLFCVSAWNDNGKEAIIDETQPDLLYRSDFFGGLGWMMTRELWNELSGKWPKSYWDDWIRNPAQRKDRACIRPEVSRTKTFGKVGVSNGLFFDKHLKHIKLSSAKVDFTKKNLGYLKKERYDPVMDADLNRMPVVRLEEIQSMAAHGKHKAVRLLYHTKVAFKKYAKVLGLMDDFKAGVPRMAYRGVVSAMNKGLRVFVAPSLSWKGYDPKW